MIYGPTFWKFNWLNGLKYLDLWVLESTNFNVDYALKIYLILNSIVSQSTF